MKDVEVVDVSGSGFDSGLRTCLESVVSVPVKSPFDGCEVRIGGEVVAYGCQLPAESGKMTFLSTDGRLFRFSVSS